MIAKKKRVSLTVRISAEWAEWLAKYPRRRGIIVEAGLVAVKKRFERAKKKGLMPGLSI